MKDNVVADRAPFDQLKTGAWSNELVRAKRQLSGQVTANVFLSFIVLILTLLVVYLAFFRQPKPYVLEVDTTGAVAFKGFIEQEMVSGEKFIPSQLMAFVENWRTVTPDNTMQKRNIKRLYCMAPKASSTFNKLNEYFRTSGNDPFKKNENGSVWTQTRQVSKLAGNTYQIEWYETERLHDGSIVGSPSLHKATMIIEQRSIDTDCIEGNPLGIYVMDLNWTIVQ